MFVIYAYSKEKGNSCQQKKKKKKVRRKKKENKLHRKERTKARLQVTLVAYLEFHPTVYIGTLQFTNILKQKETH